MREILYSNVLPHAMPASPPGELHVPSISGYRAHLIIKIKYLHRLYYGYQAHFHRPWARCSARWFYSFLAKKPSQTGMQGICGLLALDPLLRDIAPNLPATHTIPTLGQPNPCAVKMWTFEPGLRPSSGLGMDVRKVFPAFARVSPAD